jgi:hypothetical protein
MAVSCVSQFFSAHQKKRRVQLGQAGIFLFRGGGFLALNFFRACAQKFSGALHAQSFRAWRLFIKFKFPNEGG